MPIPSQYSWLNTIGTLPKMVTEALKLYGTRELAGPANNATILSWAKETGLARQYTADATPWCALFMTIVAQRAGYGVPTHPLWALNWQSFGAEDHQPLLGDVLVFVRPDGGHVGLYISEDQNAYHVLGGNQADQVSIARVPKVRLKAARAPLFKVGRPASAKPYVVAATGALSSNEA